MSDAQPPTSPQRSWMTWTGRVLSALPVLLLLFSAAMKLSRAPQVQQGFAKFGFDARLLVPIGVIELLCTVLYVIPGTAMLGAVLLAGYLGGAVVTELRGGGTWAPPLVLGVLVWAGLWLRDARLRALLPLR